MFGSWREFLVVLFRGWIDPDPKRPTLSRVNDTVGILLFVSLVVMAALMACHDVVGLSRESLDRLVMLWAAFCLFVTVTRCLFRLWEERH